MSLSRRINGNRGLETAPTDDAATFAITSMGRIEKITAHRDSRKVVTLQAQRYPEYPVSTAVAHGGVTAGLLSALLLPPSRPYIPPTFSGCVNASPRYCVHFASSAFSHTTMMHDARSAFSFTDTAPGLPGSRS